MNQGESVRVQGRERFFGLSLDDQSDVPLYLQLQRHLESLISDGALRVGDALPSEAEFCQFYKISRTTVRQAFSKLEKAGVVTRIRGKGTFISEPKFNRSLNSLYSFSGEIEGLGLSAGAELLSFQITAADAGLRQCFEAGAGELSVYQIVRLRTVNGVPLTIETVYIPVAKCPGLSEEQLQGASLYQILRERAGITPDRATEVYSATAVHKPEAKLLQCPSGTSAFMVERTSRDTGGQVFEFARILVRGDRCRYEVERSVDNTFFLRQVD